jgi:hypothetical protein
VASPYKQQDESGRQMVRELLEKIMIRHSAEGKISSSATKREENVIKDVEEEKNSANI